jgi:hypothetical protein
MVLHRKLVLAILKEFRKLAPPCIAIKLLTLSLNIHIQRRSSFWIFNERDQFPEKLEIMDDG